ncbi:MAG: SMI1/KNR4 family protein [Alphaproteobacteria bacterium]
MRLAEAFPAARFFPAATPEAIAKAEVDLGVSLPTPLKQLYLECDGFREPLGNACFLFPLTEMVRNTRFLWTDLAASLEGVSVPDFRPFLIFGSSTADQWWGIRSTPPHDIIAWHHNMLGDEDLSSTGGYEIAGSDIINVMKSDFALYDRIEQDLHQ